MRYANPFMNAIMTPPSQEIPNYDNTAIGMSSMRVIKDTSGLGGGVPNDGGFWNISVSTVAISAIVISALAFMALCVVSMSRR